MERIMCSKCREVKDETEFYYKEKSHKFNSYCRRCESLYKKEYRKMYKQRNKKNPKRYAVYKGDTFLFEGTIKECAEHFNVKRSTIRWWSYPANHRRAKKNAKVAIVIDDEQE